MTILEKLKGVYNKTEYAEYVGGTLLFKLDDDLKLLTFDNIKGEELFWLAMNYLKYKTPKHCFYNKASEIVAEKLSPEQLVAILH